MKKIILLALTAVMMAGCTTKNSDGSYKLDGGFNTPNHVVIDSCEYICWGHGLAHKGNCRFCKERRQKEMEELAIKLKEK